MRAMLTALILGVSVAAAAAPALAAEEGRDIEVIAAGADTGSPQISVGVVAGSDEQGPAMTERYEKN